MRREFGVRTDAVLACALGGVERPVGVLKIDRAFIRNLDSDAESMPIVQTIISLTHALGRKGVAEGVETEAQAKLLRGMRCDQYQVTCSASRFRRKGSSGCWCRAQACQGTPVVGADAKPLPWHFARCLKPPLDVPLLKAYFSCRPKRKKRYHDRTR